MIHAMRIVLLILILFLLGPGCSEKRQEGGVTWESVQQKIKQGMKPKKQGMLRVLEPLNVSSVEVPKERPMIGEEGVDKYGYPRKAADKVGLLALLRAKKYDELTEYIESFQREFEEDFKKEYWPFRAINSFYTADPRIKDLLDEWVALHPKSFAPYAARGVHLDAVGWAYRGGAFASKTSKKQFKTMKDYHRQAIVDLEKALELNPKVIVVYTIMMAIHRSGGEDKDRLAVYEKAKASCPNCYLPSLQHMWNLEPRWGGSFEKMQQLANQVALNKTANPRMALLQGFVPYEKCKTLKKEKPAEAVESCSEALTHGDSEWFYYARGNAYRKMKKHAEAVADYERALKITPHMQNVLRKYTRSLCAKNLKRWKDAGEALLTLLRLNPVEKNIGKFRNGIKNTLVSEGTRLYGEEKNEEAITYFRLASNLDPDDKAVAARLAKILAGEDPRDESEKKIAELVSRSYKEPSNIDVYIKLDEHLFKRGKLKKIVAHWNRFIAANPNVGRAHMERSGTYYHLKDRENALKDATKACELGMKKACHYAEQMKDN